MHSDLNGTARRDVSIKNSDGDSDGWGPSFPPYFFSRSLDLASRRTPLSERLGQANSVSVELVCRQYSTIRQSDRFVEGIPRTFFSDR